MIAESGQEEKQNYISPCLLVILDPSIISDAKDDYIYLKEHGRWKVCYLVQVMTKHRSTVWNQLHWKDKL